MKTVSLAGAFQVSAVRLALAHFLPAGARFALDDSGALLCHFDSTLMAAAP